GCHPTCTWRSGTCEFESAFWVHSDVHFRQLGGASGGASRSPIALMSRRERQRRRNRNRGHPVRRVFVLAVVLSLVAAGAGIAGVAGWVVNVAGSAPDIAQLKPRNEGQLSEVFASDCSLLGYIYSDTL